MEHSVLRRLVSACLGEGVSDAVFEPIPTGKFNESYFVRADGADYVLRIAPPADAGFVFYERNMMLQEPAIHRLLLERTDIPAARIFGCDDSHSVIDRTCLLMERLPGTALSHAPGVDPAHAYRQVGRMLAEAHSLTADAYGYLGAHRPMEPQPTWWRAFEDMWRRMLEDVARAGYYDDAQRQRLDDLLQSYRQCFDREVHASLLHMDVWSQNILVDSSGTVTGLVDWDRALWGDPEIEFAVLDYCGVSVPAFWEGYGRSRDTSEAARIRQVFYLLYEVQKYIVIRHWRSRDPHAASRYRDRVLAIAEANL